VCGARAMQQARECALGCASAKAAVLQFEKRNNVKMHPKSVNLSRIQHSHYRTMLALWLFWGDSQKRPRKRESISIPTAEISNIRKATKLTPLLGLHIIPQNVASRMFEILISEFTKISMESCLKGKSVGEECSLFNIRHSRFS